MKNLYQLIVCLKGEYEMFEEKIIATKFKRKRKMYGNA